MTDQYREAIRRIYFRIQKWKAGLAGEVLKDFAEKADYLLLDDDFRNLARGENSAN
ncbi:MAG: hypothetical protein J7K36_01280 [Archaeoglobaceae archaeon]|nr:hypothetical protein [Archaeoglobaceae archaeon]